MSEQHARPPKPAGAEGSLLAARFCRAVRGYGTTGRLLACVLARPHGERRSVREVPFEQPGAQRPWRLYEPRGPIRGTLVLVHGVTARAAEDPLLVHLARCLGSLGYRCLTPALERLAGFEHSTQDVDTVEAAYARASELQGGRVGVLGFSYGASYALRAAARDAVRERCLALLVFGAYHSLPEALEHQRQWLVRSPDPARDDVDLAYLRYTLLICHREQLDLPVAAWRAIEAALANFTSPAPVAERRAALLRYASHVDYVDLMERYQRRDLSPELSPAGRLGRIRCSVGLLHDATDRFVPPSHAERLARELGARDDATQTRSLVTPMLSHVRVDPWRSLRDLPMLVRMLEPVLGITNESP